MAKRILLIITGSIAAYKALDTIRSLRKNGHDVVCVMTEGAKQFITPLSVASLSGNPVYSELFSLKDETEMGHIRLSREADVILVAPATANIIAHMAQGIADDLATNILLASNKPIFIAPAMNSMMWEHPATKRNIVLLEKDGIRLIGPGSGSLACGEQGEGRMVEPEMITSVIEAFLLPSLPLKGLKALVTSGPTWEAIDPVRYIANRSSGKQGHAIAEALANQGAEVTLIPGPVSIPNPKNVNVIKIESAQEMLAACMNSVPVDIAICAAAVADWRTTTTNEQKLKKEGKNPPSLSLIENPDILATLSTLTINRPRLVIGFAAETEKLASHAEQKRLRKKCNWLLANDVSCSESTFGSDTNKILFLDGVKTEHWPLMDKNKVAQKLVEKIIEENLAGSSTIIPIRSKT